MFIRNSSGLTGVYNNWVTLWTKVTNLALKSVRYSRVIVYNRYNRVSLEAKNMLSFSKFASENRTSEFKLCGLKSECLFFR